ncbi:MAG: hypothetical protein QW366_04485 [Sulfolobales archaeon]
MRYEDLKKHIERYIIYILIDLLILLTTLNILKLLLSNLGIDVDFSSYSCATYCYPYYLIAASSYIDLLLLALMRILITSSILTEMILIMLPMSSVLFYLDLFTRKGLSLTILPFIVIYSKDSFQSLSIDLGQLSLLIFTIILVLRFRSRIDLRKT